MKSIMVNTPGKIIKNKKKLEEKLFVSINIFGKKATIAGKEFDEYVALKILEAISLGFKISEALLLLDEEYIFEKLNIKEISRRKNLSEVRARCIGTNGRTLDTLERLSDCFITLHDNTIGIIGHVDEIKDITNAIKSLIQGSKQSSVYSYLEKSRHKITPKNIEEEIRKLENKS